MAFNNYMPQPAFGQYNTLAPYQQRLDMMQQQWGAMQPQQMQPVQQPSPQIKGWPVAGEEDARRAMIEPMDPSVYFFPDLANGRVYTKQINPETFAPVFRTYQLSDIPPVVPAPQIDMSAYARQDEVTELRSLVSALQDELAKLSVPAQSGPKEAKK